MLTDQQLIDLMIYEPSWEDVIEKIIKDEGMDPWNIDIIRLANIYVHYLEKIQTMDLRIPARFILIAAVLLRLKSDIFEVKGTRNYIAESDVKEEELLRILANIPPLQPPLKRVPVGNVSMEELLRALGKAFEVKERRVERKRKIHEMVHRALPEHEEDITKRIDDLLAEINGALAQIDNIEFSRLVKHWERKEIVKSLMPLLHLATEGKINIHQHELFKEITIEVKK
ncbi:MAG: segregation/condensation protein A [Nanoarchaeota archaeon]|nr:segregation/condensation protein A [Nanoarchaeota archaeon]MBU4124081.1 segregation/condensation protein A [Nanoarchaeota archaeon]